MKSQNLILILVGIVCIGLLPKAQAVSPAPDGGYSGGNTAEGQFTTPEFGPLLKKEWAYSKGEVGHMDYDPWLGAQDGEIGKPVRFSVETESPDMAVVSMPYPYVPKWPYFQKESNGGISAEWSNDSSVALVTLAVKWGPHDIFLLELRYGKPSRMTNILAKAHDLLLPDFRKAKPERYNEYFDFIFESEEEPICELVGTKQVQIEGHATTDPKGLSRRRWSAQVKAVWDIPQAKFVSTKISAQMGKKARRLLISRTNSLSGTLVLKTFT